MSRCTCGCNYCVLNWASLLLLWAVTDGGGVDLSGYDWACGALITCWQYWEQGPAHLLFPVVFTGLCFCIRLYQTNQLSPSSGRGFLLRPHPLPLLLVTGGGYLGYQHYKGRSQQKDGAPPPIATPTEVHEDTTTWSLHSCSQEFILSPPLCKRCTKGIINKNTF